MRRMMVLVLLALGWVALGVAPAQACDVMEKPPGEQLREAQFVFSGTVTKATADPATSGKQTLYVVKVDSVFQGELERQVTISSPTRFRSCGLRGINVGDDYMFYAGSERQGILQARSYEGTTELTPQVRKNVVDVLGPGAAPGIAEDPESAEDTTAETTVVDEGKPPSMTSAVGPGLGLVALGLLGLLLSRALGRRTS